MWQPHVFVALFGLLSLYGKGADCQHSDYTLNAQWSVSVASGLCVEIPCTFTVPAGSTLSTRVTGIWHKKPPKIKKETPDIVAASTEASMVSEGTKGRFTLTGKVQEGDCSFSISNAQPADQGEYVFRIEDGSHKYSYIWNKLSVSVTGANSQHPGYTLNVRSVSVASGLCVEIPCNFTVPDTETLSANVTGIWRRKETPDIFAASTEASMVSEGTKGRFTLTGKVQEGDCSFSISNAQPADQGVYEFRIEDITLKYSYSCYRLSVSVTDLPEPTISPGGKLIAGKPITLTCTAHPAPQGCKGIITWGGRINMRKLYNYEREDQADKSVMRFTPSQREHNSSLTCTVTYSGVSTNSSITLDVQYSPSINITVSGYNGTYENKSLTITEGDSVNISCNVKSRPKADISWGEGQGYNVIKAPRERVLVLQNVSVADGVTYTCLARNTHGSVSGTVTITIAYAPRSSFISNCNQSEGCRVEAIEGTSLSLLCSAESNPPANLSWAKTGQSSTDPLNSSSGRLDVSHVTTNNEGDYMCRARNEHGNSTASAIVVIIYAPRRLTITYCNITDCSVHESSSVVVQEGNSLYLRCDADSNPVGNVVWVKQMKNGEVVPISLTAQLNVINVTAEHGGNYMCQTMNRVGNTSKSISVVIKSLTDDTNHLLILFIRGISITVLSALITMIAVLVMRYRKKRRPLQQADERKRLSQKDYEVVYINTE